MIGTQYICLEILAIKILQLAMNIGRLLYRSFFCLNYLTKYKARNYGKLLNILIALSLQLVI